ncbi:MAG TPA: HD domain-containing protein [Terriglobia bacterium]|nr:HD domain-containing protein [Terriglobia bacterium]
MKQDFVAELKPESAVHTTFLVHIKERKTANNGSAYMDLAFRDSSGVISAKLWDCDRFKLDFEAGDVVLVDGSVEEYRGASQIRVRKIVRCAPEEFDLRDYLPRSLRDPAEMYAALLERLRRVPEGPLRSLLLAVMEDPEIAEKYKYAPAATSFHHAYLGGLLEHVSSLVELGDKICDHYQWLDRDLALAGLVLHDLGKIEELSFTRGFAYTTRGQLLGHITIGLEIVGGKMRQIQDFPGALRDKIEHLILSHHGKMEFGSPKEPMFPEALLVHHLDDMDSKLESMRAQFVSDKDRAGDFTARNRALGRELLKPAPRAAYVAKPEAVKTSAATISERPQLDFRNGQKKP